ncbi:saccharopine dehydrogenase NADP-binding domain-containing protein, partial [Actinomyces sp. 186855]
EAARDLVQSEAVSSVTIADVDIKKAERVCQQLYSSKIEAKQVDASNERKLAALMNEHDVVINALFYAFNETVAKTAIQVGVHSVDLGGHIGHITDRILQLHEKAKQAGVTIIPDLGVAPGMINILSGYG